MTHRYNIDQLTELVGRTWNRIALHGIEGLQGSQQWDEQPSGAVRGLVALIYQSMQELSCDGHDPAQCVDEHWHTIRFEDIQRHELIQMHLAHPDHDRRAPTIIEGEPVVRLYDDDGTCIGWEDSNGFVIADKENRHATYKRFDPPQEAPDPDRHKLIAIHQTKHYGREITHHKTPIIAHSFIGKYIFGDSGELRPDTITRWTPIDLDSVRRMIEPPTATSQD